MNALLGFAWPISASLVERLAGCWCILCGSSLSWRCSRDWQFARCGGIRRRRGTLSCLRIVVLVAAPAATWLLLPGVSSNISASRGDPLQDKNRIARPRLGPTPPCSPAARCGQASQILEFLRRITRHRTPCRPHAPAIDQPAPFWSQRITAFLKPWLAWVVAGWSLGVVVCSLRPLLGWHTLRRLRRVGVSPASDEVLATLQRVSEDSVCAVAVTVLQSTLAQVPVVIWYVRPVILLRSAWRRAPRRPTGSHPGSRADACAPHDSW